MSGDVSADITLLLLARSVTKEKKVNTILKHFEHHETEKRKKRKKAMVEEKRLEYSYCTLKRMYEMVTNIKANDKRSSGTISKEKNHRW